MDLVSKLEPIFRMKIVSKDGTSARYSSLQDVVINSLDMKGDVTEVHVTITLQTDLGDTNQEIIIRQYSDKSRYEKELEHYRILEERILSFNFMNFIELMSIINLDPNVNRIVYFVEPGMLMSEIDDETFNPDETWGKVVSILQGIETYSLAKSNVQVLIEYMIQFLPIDNIEKEKIQTLLQPHFPILQFTHGGYKPYTLFDPSYIRVKKVGLSYQVYIPINIVDEPVIDRMTDIATLFSLSAFKEFKEKGEIAHTKYRIKQFYEGYNKISLEISNNRLQELYPHGATLDLQMLISFFLHEMMADRPFEDQDTLRYMYFLLMKKPFILI